MDKITKSKAGIKEINPHQQQGDLLTKNKHFKSLIRGMEQKVQT
jgi:hypothetical protein